MTIRKLLLLTAILALVAAACGTDEPLEVGGGTSPTTTEPPPTEAPPADTPPSLPPADEPLTPIAGACHESNPDCEDTLVDGDEPLLIGDEPDGSVQPGQSSGFVIGGGLSVSEALATDATGIIAVQGFVVADDSGILLCELLAESLPPLCGGATLELADLDTVDPDELRTDQGVTWSEQPVTVLGEIVDGVLTPDPFSA